MTTLNVSGATLYYEMDGAGPVLLMIPGGPADAGVFAALSGFLTDRYTVVAYDPRGNSRSVPDDPSKDQDIDVHGDDAAALLAAVTSEPAYVLGSSGGAQIGLNLAARHAARVHTLVAHEPPCAELLPDAAEARAGMEEAYQTYRTQGVEAGLKRFEAAIGMEGRTRRRSNPLASRPQRRWRRGGASAATSSTSSPTAFGRSAAMPPTWTPCATQGLVIVRV